MYRFLLLALLFINALTLEANAQDRFEMNDIFSLQYANDIQIAPNGQHIVYRRMGFDVMQDRSTGALWIMKADGSNHHGGLMCQSLFKAQVSSMGDEGCQILMTKNILKKKNNVNASYSLTDSSQIAIAKTCFMLTIEFFYSTDSNSKMDRFDSH